MSKHPIFRYDLYQTHVPERQENEFALIEMDNWIPDKRLCLALRAALTCSLCRFAPVELRSHPTGIFFESISLILAEGVGFEPTVTLLPRSISSRVPSTGLSHPS